MLTDSLFKVLFKLRVLAGLFPVESTKQPKFIIYTYLIGLFIVFFVQIIGQVVVITFKMSLGDGSDAACVVAMFSENCMIIVFNLWRGHRAEENYKNTARVVDAVLRLSDVEDSLRSVKKYSKVINWLIITYAVNVTTIQVLQILIKALSFIQVVDLVPDHYLWIYAMPWPVNTYTYWPTLALEGLSTLFMIIIQQVNIYFIITMTVLQTLGWKHLRTSLACAIRPREEESFKGQTLQLLKPLYKSKRFAYIRELEQDEKMKSWVNLHSELIVLSKEFLNIYTPMFLFHFLVVFCILLAAVFCLMQNADFFGVTEAILLGIYFSGVMFNLFLLCIAGSNLTLESRLVFEEAFQGPWYDCSPRTKSSLFIICTAAKRSVVLTPFGSEHFTFSLHTFILVMKSMASVYIGLAEVKRMAEEAQ